MFDETADEQNAHPAHFGEERRDPRRTFCLLRAWMLWRATEDSWRWRIEARSNEVDAEEERLVRDVNKIRAAGQVALLGNNRADELFRHWVPSLAENLSATPAATGAKSSCR